MKKELGTLALFDKKMAPYVREITKRFWDPPHVISRNIVKNLSEIPALINLYDQVIVSGETNNISIYLIGRENIIIFTPFMDVQNNIVFCRTLPNVLVKYSNNLYLVKKNWMILENLEFPKVVLINPCVKDVFPTPRLALCVSSIAGYLRKYQKGDVHIIDMQIGPIIDTLIEDIKDIRPDIVGISISFGQLPLCIKLLEKIFSEIVVQGEPIVIAGNAISTFAQEELLTKFPDILVCNGEGERTMIDLVDYVKGNKKHLNEISGITYIENHQIKRTHTVEVGMDYLPLPAMDTLEEIIENKGALTWEISRGCSHSACTFCPRFNKPIKWKGMSSEVVLRQLEYYKKIFNDFNIERRIYMADEEFIGWINNDMETERITKIMRGIKENFDIRFDQSTRVDQIYNLGKNKEWHVKRMKTLVLCKEAGLDRLLLGIESGSDTVLKRFNKNIIAHQSIMAVRILTALGIGLRITFITFDPLMNFKELRKNISMLENNNIFLKTVDLSKITYSELFDAIYDNDFIMKNSLHRPLYEHIAYMLVNLEVLLKSKYVNLLRDSEIICGRELFIQGKPDYNMARYTIKYLNPIIGQIAINCQRWVDKHFSLDYCLKSMYKVATEKERTSLFQHRVSYRKLSFLLLKTLVWMFDPEDTLSLKNNLQDIRDIVSDLKAFKEMKNKNSSNELISNCLELFNKKMKTLVLNIEDSINKGEILDSGGQLKNVINQWWEKKGWRLINPI